MQGLVLAWLLGLWPLLLSASLGAAGSISTKQCTQVRITQYERTEPVTVASSVSWSVHTLSFQTATVMTDCFTTSATAKSEATTEDVTAGETATDNGAVIVTVTETTTILVDGTLSGLASTSIVSGIETATADGTLSGSVSSQIPSSEAAATSPTTASKASTTAVVLPSLSSGDSGSATLQSTISSPSESSTSLVGDTSTAPSPVEDPSGVAGQSSVITSPIVPSNSSSALPIIVSSQISNSMATTAVSGVSDTNGGEGSPTITTEPPSGVTPPMSDGVTGPPLPPSSTENPAQGSTGGNNGGGDDPALPNPTSPTPVPSIPEGGDGGGGGDPTLPNPTLPEPTPTVPGGGGGGGDDPKSPNPTKPKPTPTKSGGGGGGGGGGGPNLPDPTIPIPIPVIPGGGGGGGGDPKSPKPTQPKPTRTDPGGGGGGGGGGGPTLPNPTLPEPTPVIPGGGGGGGGNDPTLPDPTLPTPIPTIPGGGGGEDTTPVPTLEPTPNPPPSGASTPSSSPSSSSSSSSSSSPAPQPTLCPGLSGFGRQVVAIDGLDYIVPSMGDDQHFMMNDEQGTEFIISPSRVVIGSQVFSVPSEPPILPSTVSSGGYTIVFHTRGLPALVLFSPDSTPAQSYARQVAENYIEFSKLMLVPISGFFVAVNHFYARLGAPSAQEADGLLGNEASTLDAIKANAKILAVLVQSAHQEEWEGFLNQVLHVQDDEEDMGSLPDHPSPQQYIDRVFPGLAGINDLCQRSPWRIEALMNLARFFTRDSWVSTPRLVAFLHANQDRYMSTSPGGSQGLQSGGGALVSGMTGVSIVSKTQLSTQRDLFVTREWFLSPVLGTPWWWAKSLADFLDGSSIIVEGTDPDIGFSYVFKMSFSQGEAIMYSLEVDWLVEIQWIFDTLEEKLAQMARGAIGLHLLKENRTLSAPRPRGWLEDPVPPFFNHQRLVSAGSTAQRPLAEQPYRRDSSGGEGITVFIMDTGFDLTGQGAEELGMTGKQVSDWTYIVPQAIQLANFNTDEFILDPESLNDDAVDPFGQYVGHGTCVASVAIGRTHGIAPKADAYLIKISSSLFWVGHSRAQATYDPRSSEDALKHIIEVVKKRNLQGKAVVNHSYGVCNRESGWTVTKWKQETKMWKRRLAELEALGVVFVQSAGNEGYEVERPGEYQLFCKTGMMLPTNLGRDDNNIITVSSVNEHGQWSPWASPWGADANSVWGGQQGHITTYAQGENVAVYWRGRTDYREGTSVAAPAVAGLAAYFLGLEKEKFKWEPDGKSDYGKRFCQKLKHHITNLHYRRIPMEYQFPNYPIPFQKPVDVPVAYNGILGEQPNCYYPLMGAMAKREEVDPNDPGYHCPYTPTPTPTTKSTSSTSTTTKTYTPWPTEYYNPPTAAGCTDSSCTHCEKGFKMVCVIDAGAKKNICHCEYESGCSRDATNIGECAEPCPTEQARRCDIDNVDKTSYPYGRCDCAKWFTVSACHIDKDCELFACDELDEICLCDSPWCACVDRYETRPFPGDDGANRTSKYPGVESPRNVSFSLFH